MKSLLLIIGLTIWLGGCANMPQPTRTEYVSTKVPASLVDCDRWKRTYVQNPQKLTDGQIATFIANRERIIDECFQDVQDLRAFLEKNNLIIETSNSPKKK